MDSRATKACTKWLCPERLLLPLDSQFLGAALQSIEIFLIRIICLQRRTLIRTDSLRPFDASSFFINLIFQIAPLLRRQIQVTFQQALMSLDFLLGRAIHRPFDLLLKLFPHFVRGLLGNGEALVYIDGFIHLR